MAVARPAKRRATERCGVRGCASGGRTMAHDAQRRCGCKRPASLGFGKWAASAKRTVCIAPVASRAPTTRTVKAGVRCGGRGRAHGQPRRRHSTEREAAAVGSCRLCEANSGLKQLDVGEEARNRTRLPAPRKADRTREEGLRRAARERRRRCVDAVGRRGRNKATAVRERTTHTRADTAGQERTEAATHRGGAHADAAGEWKGDAWNVHRVVGGSLGTQLGHRTQVAPTCNGQHGGKKRRRGTLWRVVHKGSVKMQRVAMSAMLACGLALALWSLPALANNGQGKALSEDTVQVVCKLSALLKRMSLEAEKLGSVATLATGFEASEAEEDMDVMREALGSAARLLRQRAAREEGRGTRRRRGS
ncbi:hypothetical protein ERJ75_001397800 [Trypanosoma vivax]|nr:hypothetical protein ERJ75_001397800 [Trypanosoma vivax]